MSVAVHFRICFKATFTLSRFKEDKMILFGKDLESVGNHLSDPLGECA